MDRKGRPLYFAVGTVLLSAIVLAVVEWPHVRAWYQPPRADLPTPNEVVRMEATVWASGSQGMVETDIPPFVVPEAVAPRFWKRFSPNTYLPRPRVQVDTPLGELVVTATDGRVTRIWFYESGPDELVFTPDREQFFLAEPRDVEGHPLGGSLLLTGALRHAAGAPGQVDVMSGAAGPLVDPAALTSTPDAHPSTGSTLP